jgi:hypothetical protein
MAQTPSQPGNDGAAFIREIVADPKSVPDVMLLYGYLGASSEEDHDRLYLSRDLTNYVEVPKKAVLYRMTASKEQDPHGGVTLWVSKDAALIYKMAPAAEALAQYFAGAIQAQGAYAAAWPAAAAATMGACGVPHPTHGATCAPHATCGADCSIRCPTEITPCVNTHANTCHCPVTAACPTAACGSMAGCTYIGCGHTLACTQGLLCANAQAMAPQTIGACTLPQALCPVTQHTCAAQCSIGCPTQPPHATCAQGCTHITPCLHTQVGQATCAIQCTIGPLCQTHHATCAPICTLAAACLPTRAQPQCPFPTEATCAPVCHASPAAVCGGNLTAAGCGASAACGFGGQGEQAAMAQCFGGSVVGTVPVVCTAACSVVCPSQGFVCGSHHTPCCPVPIHTFAGASCAFVCGSQHSLCCPVSGGAFCPPVSLGCPGSLACGQPGLGGAGPQAMAGHFTAFCTPAFSPMCTGVACQTPAHPCTPHCPQ